MWLVKRAVEPLHMLDTNAVQNGAETTHSNYNSENPQRRLLADVRMSDPACHFAHSEQVAPIDRLASNHQIHPPSPNKKVAALLSLVDKGASALDATAYLVPFGV